MEYEQKIKMAETEKLSPLEIFLSIEKLKWQIDRLVSDSDSEEGTFQREIKRVREDVLKLETEYRSMMFDSDKGVVLKVDRLSVKVDRHDQIMIGITIGVVVALFIAIINLVFKK